MLRKFLVPLGHVPNDIGMDRVEVPASIRSAFLHQVRRGVMEARVPTVSKRRHEIEADEEVVVVVHGIVEAIPRFVVVSLAMQFSLEEKFGSERDGALHVLGPFLPWI